MRAHPRPRQAGFTYLGLIIFVFIVGLVGAATLKIGALLQRAHTEEELLEIGYQFSVALRSYADATPRGQPQQPLSLQELLRDPRFPNPRRHLRKIFVDPVTGKAEWGLVRAGEGGRILGVHSLSRAAPLKLANFDQRFPGFERREHIADWKFMAELSGAGAPQAPGTLPPSIPAPPLTPGAMPPAPPLTPTPATPPQAPPQPEPEPPKDEPPAEEPPAEEKPAEPPEESKEPKEPSAPTTQSQDFGR